MFSFKVPPFPVVLAPMAGVTDLPFRVICRENGADYTVSEMVSAKALLYKNQKTFAMLTIDPKEHPTAIQLFGSVPSDVRLGNRQNDRCRNWRITRCRYD